MVKIQVEKRAATRYRAAAFHTWLPSEDEMAWLASKYPDTFERYYRPRFEHWAQVEKDPGEGRWFNQFLPMLCQTCQIPMLFTEPGDPTQICFREASYLGQKYHFCSDHCQRIFEHEPKKYSQAWLPVHQIYQGACYPEDINPASPGDSPVREVLRYYGIEGGADNGDFMTSPDRRHFAEWSGRRPAADPQPHDPRATQPHTDGQRRKAGSGGPAGSARGHARARPG